MYNDDSGILNLVMKCVGITNTSLQNFAVRISSVKTTEMFAGTKCFVNIYIYKLYMYMYACY